jgi:hypothetical protein
MLLLAAAAPGRHGLTHAALLGLAVEQLRFTPDGLVLDLPGEHHAGTTHDGEESLRRLVIPCAARPDRCPVRALRAWLRTSNTLFGPVFRKIDRWGNVEHHGLGPDALRRIVARRTRRAPRSRTSPP